MRRFNLPSYNIKIIEKDGKKYVYDALRRKEVALTPEEWVRQHFINYLVSMKSFPPERMANEVTIRLNGLSKRCDTVVYDDYMNPLLIAEYKAPDIPVSTTVFEQIVRYNYRLKVPYLIVSNGITHYCCHIDYRQMTYNFLRKIPTFTEIK